MAYYSGVTTHYPESSADTFAAGSDTLPISQSMSSFSQFFDEGNTATIVGLQPAKFMN